MSSTYFGWIPTNLGFINFDLIGENEDSLQYKETDISNSNYISIKDIDLNFISDSYFPKSSLVSKLNKNSKEYYLSGNIEFNKEENKITGFSTLTISKNKKLLSKWYFHSKISFEIEYNGKIKFYNLKIDTNVEYYDTFQEDIAFIFYIIIKNTVHGNNHHHQKIDTALYITKDEFKPFDILNNFAQHIKRLEYDVKSIDKCFGKLKILNSKNEVDGYKSYIGTFIELFFDKNDKAIKAKVESKEKIIDNVIISLKANVEKQEVKNNFQVAFVLNMITFFAILISLNIFANALDVKKDLNLENISNISIIINSFFVIFFFYYKSFKCHILNRIFYKKYYEYESFDHLKYHKIDKISKKIKVISFFVKNIHFSMLIIVSIINTLLYYYIY